MATRVLGKAAYQAHRTGGLVTLTATGQFPNFNDKADFDQLPFSNFPAAIRILFHSSRHHASSDKTILLLGSNYFSDDRTLHNYCRCRWTARYPDRGDPYGGACPRANC